MWRAHNNNWSSLLALRKRLRTGEDRSASQGSDGGQSDNIRPDERGSNAVTQIRHSQYRPATKQQRQQVLDLYRSGLSIHEIAQQAGVNRSSVNRICRNAGLSRKPQGNEAQRHRARAFRAQGLTLAQVAREVGCSRSTIQRWLADSDNIPSNHDQTDTKRNRQ